MIISRADGDIVVLMPTLDCIPPDTAAGVVVAGVGGVVVAAGAAVGVAADTGTCGT